MSRSRSRSPHYRRFPWEEADFDPRTVVAKLDGNPQDRGHHPREGPEDFRDPYWEERYPEGPRRSPFQDDFHFRHQRHSDHEEFHRWAESPPRDAIPLEDRRFSQRDKGDSDAGSLLPRLRGLSNTQRVYAEHHTKKAWEGRRREEQDRDQGRPRDFSPGMRSGDQRAEEMLKEARFPEYPNRGRQREGWDPAFKRPRREMDFVDHPGYREEKDFVDRGYSVHRPRGGFRDRTRGSSGPFVGEHDHSVERGRNQQQFENFEDRRNDPNFDRQRSPSSAGSSQEHFRKSTSRPRENSRGKHFQNDSRHGNYQEPRRSPNTMRYDQQGGPENYRGRGRELDDRGPRGRAEPNRNQLRYQDRTQGGQRPDHHPIRDYYNEKIPNWIDEDKVQQWRQSRSRSLEQNSPWDDLDPKRPPQRNQAWRDQQPDNMTVITKETLTINVDMSRPLSNNSPLCYSTDRLLSMDLVNVGRTRQDFMPLLEHSGMYREKATHTGTFAQEIISLVHFVKEQYFRGDGLTLNERFSAPQKGGYSQDDSEELTLNQRFSSSRGFSLNMDSIFDDGDEFLFSKLGSMQGVSNHPQRDPGDLRHDLERRRQEKLEAVKVTIAGSSLSQDSQSSDSEPGLAPPVDHEGYSGRAGDQNRNREGSVGFRKGAYNRPNMSPQRRKAPFGNEREKKHSNPPEPSEVGTRLSAEERYRRVKENLCMYCGKPGHYVSTCPIRAKVGVRQRI